MTAFAHPLVMTIDAGSGSARALVWDRNGDLLGLAQQEWNYIPVPGWPGGYDFDTLGGWRQVGGVILGALAQAGVQPAEIVAISATSQREGFVLYDEAGDELWACPNADARAGAEALQLIEDGLAERQYRRGGDWTSITAPARLRWIKNHRPEVWGRARHMTMLGDWVLQRLSGTFVTDPSLGSSSGMFSLADRAWSAETARGLELPDILPPVFESGTVIGHVSARAAGETGLAAGTPIVTGGGDTQLGLLGAGLTRPGSFGLVSGTYWLSAAVLDRPLTDPEVRLRTLCHVAPGTWMIEGVGFMHGFSSRWVRDGLLRTADPNFPAERGYEELERLASVIPPGSNGVQYFLSSVMNARRWRMCPPSIVGFNVLDSGGTGLGAIWRAVEEEAAFGSRGHFDILAEVCGEAPREISFVGGPSRGTLWPQVVSTCSA